MSRRQKIEWAALAATAAAIWTYDRRSRLVYEWSPRRHIKKWVQRAWRGYATEDTFDFDGYLAGVIARGVQDLRDNLHGYPPDLGAPNGEWKGEAELDDEKGIAAWGEILDKIVEGFTIHTEDVLMISDEDERKAAEEKVEQAKRLFVEWFGNLWD